MADQQQLSRPDPDNPRSASEIEVAACVALLVVGIVLVTVGIARGTGAAAGLIGLGVVSLILAGTLGRVQTLSVFGDRGLRAEFGEPAISREVEQLSKDVDSA